VAATPANSCLIPSCPIRLLTMQVKPLALLMRSCGVREPGLGGSRQRTAFQDAGEPRSACLTHGHYLDAQRVGSVPGLALSLRSRPLKGAVSRMMILSAAVPLQPPTSPIRPPVLAL
jgi:hypothetical protein